MAATIEASVNRPARRQHRRFPVLIAVGRHVQAHRTASSGGLARGLPAALILRSRNDRWAKPAYPSVRAALAAWKPGRGGGRLAT